MAITKLGDTETAATSSAGATTSSQDTSGADFLLVWCTGFGGGPSLTGVSDNKGNTWTAHTVQGSNGGGRFYSCVPTSVGTGHTVTLNSSSSFGSVHWVWASGVLQSSPFDVENGANTTSGVELSSGTATPSQAGSFVATATGFFGANATTTIEVETGVFTQLGMIQQAFAVTIGGELAYEIQSGTTARTPRWDWAATEAGSSAIIVFKPAGGGGGGTFVGDGLTHGGLLQRRRLAA